MSEKMPETWISKMTGPVSALILCIFGINYLATWIDKMSERHFDSIDKMVEEDKIERKENLQVQKLQTQNVKELSENMEELATQMEKLKICCEK